MTATHDVVVVGGGHYGASIALDAARRGAGRVVLIEQGAELLGRASWANQARVHMGYHYPRSFLTGIRSRVNFDRFVAEYDDCVDGGFAAYYAIARPFSKVSAGQFEQFCRRIGAPLDAAPDRVRALFDPALIEAVFTVREVAFDASRLRQRLVGALGAVGVEVRTSTEAVRLRRVDGGLALELRPQLGDIETVVSPRVYNCTYSRTNALIRSAGGDPLSLRHEVAELALVDPPAELDGLAVTVMCGPFFSLTPFPAEGCYALSHVRYTPQRAWTETAAGDWPDPHAVLNRSPPPSQFDHMVADARRYLPVIAKTRYRRSLWEIKTILPRNDADDGRPILVHRDPALPGFTSVMGSKIDNIYDVLDALHRDLDQAGGTA